MAIWVALSDLRRAYPAQELSLSCLRCWAAWPECQDRFHSEDRLRPLISRAGHLGCPRVAVVLWSYFPDTVASELAAPAPRNWPRISLSPLQAR